MSFGTCSVAFSQEIRGNTFDGEGVQTTFKCKIQPSLRTAVDDEGEDDEARTLECKIQPSLPTYVFHFYMMNPGETGYHMVERLEISREGDPSIIQTLAFFRLVQPQEFDPAHEGFFEVEDINFDGYLDLKILFEHGGSAGEVYTYCLLNKEDGTFLCDKGIQLVDPTLNPQTKEITSSYASGASGGGTRTYKWENEKLVLVREESSGVHMDEEDGRWYAKRVLKERRNGGWWLLRRSRTVFQQSLAHHSS